MDQAQRLESVSGYGLITPRKVLITTAQTMPTEIAEDNGSGSNSGMDTASPAGSVTHSMATNASRDFGAASGASQTGGHQGFRRYYFLGSGRVGLGGGSSCDGEHSFWYENVKLILFWW